MTYILYTLPNCSECSNVKELLDKKGIEYQEINTGIGKDFSEFYKRNRDSMERENNGSLVLPILVCDSNFLQGLDKIIKFTDKL